MKPKTKEQKYLLEMVQKMPELTDKQIEYYKANSFDTEIVESRGRYVCSDCGHSWKSKGLADATMIQCPKCAKEGRIIRNQAVSKQIRYFVISRAIEGYQFLRYIQVRRRSEANKIYHWHKDVGTVVFDSRGNKTEFALGRFTMSWTRDAWSFDSEIELRNSKHNILFEIRPDALLTQSIIPVLKRNGYDGKLFHNHAAILIDALLREPTIESWWKIGHKGIVLDYLQSYTFSLSPEKLRLVRLASKHGRIFDVREDWHDFLDLIADLKYLGKDIFNPSIIFPENFQEAHRIWGERADRKRKKGREAQERQRRIQERNRQIELAKKDENKKKWLEHYTTHFASLNLERAGYRFKALVTENDFRAEADYMKHCICSYYGKQDTLLLSILFNEQKVETAEIDLISGEVVQCRGKFNNNTEHHDTIVFMLRQFMRIFKAYNEGKFLKYAKKKEEKKEEQPQLDNAVQKVA